MANSYSAPDFDIDTDINVAGLTSLKGSAPALTDNIYVYNGATLTVESALSCIKIHTGQTSGGAAGGGNRYGLIVVEAGVTVTFAGDPSRLNSGINMTPASGDASSNGCRLTVNGESGNLATFTNDGDTLDTNKRFTIYALYGTIDVHFLNYRNYWDRVFELAAATSRNDAGFITFVDSIIGITGATGYGFRFINQDIDLPVDLRRNAFTHNGFVQYHLYLHSNIEVVTGGSIDMRGCSTFYTTNHYMLYLFRGAAGTTIYDNLRVAAVPIVSGGMLNANKRGNKQ